MVIFYVFVMVLHKDNCIVPRPQFCCSIFFKQSNKQTHSPCPQPSPEPEPPSKNVQLLILAEKLLLNWSSIASTFPRIGNLLIYLCTSALRRCRKICSTLSKFYLDSLCTPGIKCSGLVANDEFLTQSSIHMSLGISEY